MGLYSLQDPYSLSSWQENQGAYDLNLGTDLLLDQSRFILNSDAYMFQGVAFPKGSDVFLDPGQTFSGSINLTPYSYIVSLTGFTGNGNQFTLRIYDKGAQTDFYFRQFAWFPTVIGTLQGSFNNGDPLLISQFDKPFGPYMLRDPMIVLPPGVLQVQLTNVSTDPTFGQNIVQVLFGIAVPKSTISMQNRKITTPTDQSGLASLVGSLVGSAA